MTVPCKTIEVLSPVTAANIVAFGLLCSSLEPNKINLTCMWKNEGGTVGLFIPKISLNGIVRDLGVGEQSVQPNYTYTFVGVLTGITAGSYTVCPVPN